MNIGNNSHVIVYSSHINLIQNMLDYDYLCGRDPSICGVVSEFGSNHQLKVFWGDKEYYLPVFRSIESGVSQFPSSSILINLASLRSAKSVVEKCLDMKHFELVVTVTEGIPEKDTIQLLAKQKQIEDQSGHKTYLLGPSTVGALFAGNIRIGHSGGSLENVMKSKLYRPGSVGFVSKSGGMMNEMCRVLSRVTDGVHSAISLGGDRFTMMNFEDVVLSYQNNNDIKMIVLLGEVGNREELLVADLLNNGTVTKPVVARISGTSAENLQTEVQFGHAGAKANSEEETAAYKNKALSDAGAHVPSSFETFEELIHTVYNSL